MKAWQITSYGKISESLIISQIREPEMSANDVMIEVYAASCNPIDYKIIKGDLKRIEKLSFPSRIGFDLSGVVSKIGSSVTKFKIGDEVFARATRETMGSFAELIALNENWIARKPKNLTRLQAASIPLVGLTTYQAFIEKAKAQPEQKILIHAGSGGVGTFAIQFARAIGLYVTTTTSSKNAEFVKNLGADNVICYDQEDYLKCGEEFDIVYDTLGGNFTNDAFKVLKTNGVVVSIAGVPDREFAEKAGVNFIVKTAISLMNRKVYRLAEEKHASYYRFMTESSGEQLSEIAQMIEAGKIRAVIDREFQFNEIREALEYLDKGRAQGKVVIKIR